VFCQVNVNLAYLNFLIYQKLYEMIQSNTLTLNKFFCTVWPKKNREIKLIDENSFFQLNFI